MNFVLSREHLGKIVRFDELTVVTLPESVFKQGDILVMFNNTDKFTTIESKMAQTYRSGMPKVKSHLEFPPRCLINVVFVADEIAIFTYGV
jgi:hypothetical protein